MGHDLVVDGAALGEAASRVSALAADLDRASEDTAALRGAVGEAAQTRVLTEAVDGFASSWRVRRESMQDTLVSLSDVLKQIDQGMSDADHSLTQSWAPAQAGRGTSRQVR